MPFMPWNTELEVGIGLIDEQHRWLVDCTNELYEHMQVAEPDHAEIARLLDGLMDYTTSHFIAEEEMFQRLNYPQAAAHKAEHDHFTAQIMSLLQRHEGGNVSGGEALELLMSWLLNHIVKVDRAYVDFFKAQGVH